MSRKKAEVKIKMICEKCGKPQKPSADKSTTNWNVYDVMKNVNVVENS